jgi:hypothetical protein
MALSMSRHPVVGIIQPLSRPADVRGRPAAKADALDASMRSRATFVRRSEFQADDRRQRVILMERMIADFDRIAADLDREILIEQERARNNDPAHFAYPTYAKAAILPTGQSEAFCRRAQGPTCQSQGRVLRGTHGCVDAMTRDAGLREQAYRAAQRDEARPQVRCFPVRKLTHG